ncbi:MAG: molybdopterin-guanine dinucleotide biosynthesis protein B, partial [Clostridia bacterium]|nr:molybdopterin-guanine dinucleotide biosynthesis protein B [Clostridia bacterium]
MNAIATVAFAAWSGTGKTTLIEKLVRYLVGKGLRVAVIKHDGHDFDIDHEQKDSWRFAKAGAEVTVVSSAAKTAVVEQRSLSLQEVLSKVRDVDLVLVEGYKKEDLPQI